MYFSEHEIPGSGCSGLFFYLNSLSIWYWNIADQNEGWKHDNRVCSNPQGSPTSFLSHAQVIAQWTHSTNVTKGFKKKFKVA